MNFFKKKFSTLPIDNEIKKFIDSAFEWMMKEFGKDVLFKKKVLTPTVEDFPIESISDERSFISLKNLICKQMDIIPNKVSVQFFEGNIPDPRNLPEGKWENQSIAGVYLGTQKNGKSYIALDEYYLKDSIGLIATLAHELAHIRLLGEKKLKSDNPEHEVYTDLLCIFYGFGLFISAVAFRTNGWTEGLRTGWSQQSSGYLTLQQIGYALGRYAFLREEYDSEWFSYISDSVAPYFKKSLKILKSENNLNK